MASSGSPRSSDSVEAWRRCCRNAESSSVASSITGTVRPARSSCVVGPARLQQPFQRAQNGPPAIALHRPRVPAETAFVAADRHQRRKPFPRLPIGRFERRPADSFRGPRPPPRYAWCQNRFPVSSERCTNCNRNAYSPLQNCLLPNALADVGVPRKEFGARQLRVRKEVRPVRTQPDTCFSEQFAPSPSLRRIDAPHPHFASRRGQKQRGLHS